MASLSLGVLLLLLLPALALAQQPPPDPEALRLQQQKSAYYTQVEYQRCRQDVVEVLSKSEGLEKRVKELEEELAAARRQSNAKPAN